MRAQVAKAPWQMAGGVLLAAASGYGLVYLIWSLRPVDGPQHPAWGALHATVMLILCPFALLLTWGSPAEPRHFAEGLRWVALMNSALYALTYAGVAYVRAKARRMMWAIVALGLIWVLTATALLRVLR
jgi:hypothetical protein